jgi:hypothetical protein
MASKSERRSASERLGETPARGRRSGQWSNRPMAAARRSKPLLALRSTKLDKIFTYGIVAMRRTNFAHLGRTSGNNGGWCGWGGSAQARRRWRWALGVPLAKPWAPAWAAAFSETPGVVDLPWAVAHQLGDELNTAARVSIFAGQILP